MNGFFSFPGNLFAILVYYFEVGDAGFGIIVGHTVFVNSTVDVTAVFFNLIIKTYAGLTYAGKVTIFFWAQPFLNSVLFTV